MSKATVPQAAKSTGFDPARLIEQHQTGVWRYLRALGCDPALADDLTQDTFLALLRRPFEDFGEASTSAYLRKVARNLWVSMHRREGKVTAVENIEAFDEAWEQWVRDDTGDEVLGLLKDCFRGLTERAQLALNLRFWERASRANIATALGITEHGAKNLMQRAKKQLRVCVEEKLQ